MEPKQNVFMWFEFNKNKISPEMDKAIADGGQKFKDDDLIVLVGSRMYRRMGGELFYDYYTFSFPYSGWKDECIGIFLEVNQNESNLTTFNNPSWLMEIENLEYGPENPTTYLVGSIMMKTGYLIKDTFYYPEFVSLDSESFFVLIPIK